jgi:hypothetical protein
MTPIHAIGSLAVLVVTPALRAQWQVQTCWSNTYLFVQNARAYWNGAPLPWTGTGIITDPLAAIRSSGALDPGATGNERP